MQCHRVIWLPTCGTETFIGGSELSLSVSHFAIYLRATMRPEEEGAFLKRLAANCVAPLLLYLFDPSNSFCKAIAPSSLVPAAVRLIRMSFIEYFHDALQHITPTYNHASPSLFGYLNFPATTWSNPSLTTLKQNLASNLIRVRTEH